MTRTSRLEVTYRLLAGEEPRQGFVRVVWRGETGAVRHTYAVRKGYRLVPCDGACQNPMSDHCLSCAPLWGVRAVLDD
jgi:hypothetical protein